MKFRPPGTAKANKQEGYILLLMMLFIALLAIAATAIAPSITFQIQRDREEELIHRGVQYSRAIRRYVKKVGRYPTRLEDLENTNSIRFLRRRYKDPLTGQDFKLLHLGEVQMTFGPGIAGANPAAGAVQGVPTLGGALLNSGGAAALQAANARANPSPSPAGQDGTTTDQDASDPNAKVADPQAGTDTQNGDKLSTQVFGGGPIVGVASTSKKKTIRVFNHKEHYNQWQFIYDPSTDRGGLLNTPAQPALQGAGVGQPIGAQPGNPQNPGMNGSPFNNNPQAPATQQPQEQPQPQPPPQQQ
jgi:type II secretory pathway pseudopilin PulG